MPSDGHDCVLKTLEGLHISNIAACNTIIVMLLNKGCGSTLQ